MVVPAVSSDGGIFHPKSSDVTVDGSTGSQCLHFMGRPCSPAFQAIIPVPGKLAGHDAQMFMAIPPEGVTTEGGLVLLTYDAKDKSYNPAPDRISGMKYWKEAGVFVVEFTGKQQEMGVILTGDNPGIVRAQAFMTGNGEVLTGSGAPVGSGYGGTGQTSIVCSDRPTRIIETDGVSVYHSTLTQFLLTKIGDRAVPIGGAASSIHVTRFRSQSGTSCALVILESGFRTRAVLQEGSHPMVEVLQPFDSIEVENGNTVTGTHAGNTFHLCPRTGNIIPVADNLTEIVVTAPSRGGYLPTDLADYDPEAAALIQRVGDRIQALVTRAGDSPNEVNGQGTSPLDDMAAKRLQAEAYYSIGNNWCIGGVATSVVTVAASVAAGWFLPTNPTEMLRLIIAGSGGFLTGMVLIGVGFSFYWRGRSASNQMLAAASRHDTAIKQAAAGSLTPPPDAIS